MPFAEYGDLVPNDTEVRRTPVTILASGALLTASAAVLITYAVLVWLQGKSFGDRAAAVDPTGPENDTLRVQATDATVAMAVFAIVAALLLLASAFFLFRRRTPFRATWRWISAVVVSVLVVLYPIRVALDGGVGIHIIAIPHTYDGDNAVRVVMTHAFQQRVTTLADITIVTLLAGIVLLLLPVSRRYYGSTVAIEDNYDLSSLARRKSE